MSTIRVVKCDITKIDCECIVNSAKKSLGDGGGVCGAIYKAAGRFRLKMACMKLNGCEVGEAKITEGFKLPSKYIIHTVGPVDRGNSGDDDKLYSCYINSLNLARENNIHSIAFPIISCGVHHYPIDRASKIAVDAMNSWLKNNSGYAMEITICCVDNDVYTCCCNNLKN